MATGNLDMTRVSLALIGFGHVGRAFVRLLDAKRALLRKEHGLTWRVTGIATRRHGGALDPQGLDTVEALRLVESNQPLTSLSTRPIPDDVGEFLRQSQAQVLFGAPPSGDSRWGRQPMANTKAVA